jgi:Adenovirus endoprotease
MNNLQILKCIREGKVKNYKRYFKGVFSCDRIPLKIEKRHKTFVILNTKTFDSVGEHWIIILYLPDKKECHIFDSLNKILTPNYFFKRHILKLQQKGFKIKFSNQVVQHFQSLLCGVFCILFFYFRMVNESYNTFLKKFDKINLRNNDKIALKLFKKHFSCSKNLKFKRPIITCNKNDCFLRWT